jgi:DNA-binding protein HU-beta
MDKGDFINAVGRKLDLANAQAKRTVEAVFEALTDALVSGDEVRLTGFGNWRVTTSTARAGRNPRTGEVTQLAAKQQVKFRPGKSLKEAVERGDERRAA